MLSLVHHEGSHRDFVGGFQSLSQQGVDLVSAFCRGEVVRLLVIHCRNLSDVAEGVDLDGLGGIHIRMFEIRVRQGDEFSLLVLSL